MIIDDPDFPRGAMVLVKQGSSWSGTYIGTVIKAIKGRTHIKVSIGKFNTVVAVLRKHASVVTKEGDPELFI